MVVYHARKTAARRMARHTGMTYTAALRYMNETRDRQPRHRWILTDPVRQFLGGESWIGLRYENLYDWLDRLDPVYRCLCKKSGDARRQDSSIRLSVVTYDPDLSPRTWLRGVNKYHAECMTSGISYDNGAEVPEGPEELKVTTGPFKGVFTLYSLAVTAPHDDRDGVPLVVVTAELVEGDSLDSIGGWMRELGRMLEGHGFRVRTGSDRGPRIPVWNIRAEPGDTRREQPPWVAVRNTPVQAGTITKHLFFGPVPEVTPEWLSQASSAGEVEVIVQPLAGHERGRPYAARVAFDPRSWSEDTPVRPLAERHNAAIEDMLHGASCMSWGPGS